MDGSRRRMLRLFAVMAAVPVAAACGGTARPLPTPAATASPTATPTGQPATPEATPTHTASPTATPSPTPSPSPAPALEPAGFPLDPATRLGVVTGPPGSSVIAWDGGPTAMDYSRDAQPSADPETANASGWNCRLHVEYEGNAAVDWYLPEGTPLLATMDGTATLSVITISNAFDYYGVDREPYLGNPDRARAPLSPFPGPGGGKGVYVELANGEYAVEYGHLDIARTLVAVPAAAYVGGHSAETDYAAIFGGMRGFRDATLVARWPVRRGEVVGYSGDSGYSEAPHLHYTVRRPGGPLLCPTAEDGFADGGWLFR